MRFLYLVEMINFPLQFEMLKHAFPFGTAMQANLVSDTSGIYQAYQDFFYNNFNYAVLENALKWRQMEPNQVQIYAYFRLRFLHLCWIQT